MTFIRRCEMCTEMLRFTALDQEVQCKCGATVKLQKARSIDDQPSLEKFGVKAFGIRLHL